MKLLEALLDAARAKAGDITVSDVRIGLGYTAVLLDTGNAGVAATLWNAGTGGCSMFQGSRPIASSSVRDVLGYMTSADMLERTVGLAAANALFNTDQARTCAGCACHGGDLLDVLELGPEDRVGMVGFFGPLVPLIRQRAGELIVFEKNMGRADGLAPAEQALKTLPACSVAVITATSIINNTFEQLAAAAASCRAVAVLGPSTPLVPGVLRAHGVTHLSGIIAENPHEILRMVSEAGGTRFFMKWSKKVNLVFKR